MEDKKLKEIVNPVFNTAKACIQLNAASGDEDSAALLKALSFASFDDTLSGKSLPEEMMAQIKRVTPAYMFLVESRFQSVNRLIESRTNTYIADLPCGYTARGLKMVRKGISYIGLDLPAVIDEVSPAANSISDGKNIAYHAVDATNFNSLDEAVPDEARNLMITTEGLLMYFNQSELDEVFSNIHRLLEKHGGTWVILDRDYTVYDSKLANLVLGNDPALTAMYNAMTAKSAGTTADVKFADNVFFDPDEEKLMTYIEKMGFRLTRTSMTDYLPGHFNSIGDDVEKDAAVREIFKSIHFWELTVAGGSYTKNGASADHTFSFRMQMQDGTLQIALNGRLDTLTSPDLLKAYQKIAEREEITGISLDLSKLDYISSAGLRVLLLMYKALKDKSNFSVEHANDAVKEIFITTGFDSAFGLDWS